MLYRIEQGGGVLHAAWTRRLGLRYTAEHRFSQVLVEAFSVGELSSGSGHVGLRERAKVNISVYTVNICSWSKGRLYHSPELSPGEGFGTPVRLRHLGL